MRGIGALVAGVAVAFAGCGDEHHPTTSARVVTAAAVKTTNARTARLSETVTGSENGRSFGDGSVHGVVDSARRRADVQFDLSAFAAAGGADPSALKARMVFAGDLVYVNSPAITPKLTPGKRWLALTRTQLEESTRISGVTTLDLTRPVDFMRASIGRAEDLGRETVNGTPTRHYRTKVDFQRYLTLVPKRHRFGLEKGVAALQAGLGGSTFPVDAWIASDSTIRRVKGTFEGRGAKVGYTLELSAIGGPVKVAPPDQALVLDGRKY